MAEAEHDYEDFLQAFERPTQIYRYMRSYHEKSPCFLQRTLSYMRYGRPKHTEKRRKSAKRCLNDLRDHKAALDHSVVSSDCIRSGGPLELSFLLFSDDCVSKSSSSLPTEAIVEVTLRKEGFRRAKESLGNSSDDVSLGTYTVPCEWRRRAGGGSAPCSTASSTGSAASMESLVVVPLGVFGFSMLGGLGVKEQKLLFKVYFHTEQAGFPANGHRQITYESSVSGLMMSPSPSHSCSSSPATFATANASSPLVVTQPSSVGESTGSAAVLMDTSPPAKRHCIAPPFSSPSPVMNGHRHSPIGAQDGGPEEEGCVDWSQWNGELTQSSAACNRKVQPLLRRNRELRGLVLDDPPDNSGLPEFSYARGRRGYTKPPAGHLLLPRPTVPTSTPAAAAKVVHTATANGGGASASATANATATATVAGISGGKVSSETPVRTPSPPIERPHSTPPTPSSVHDRAYFVEVLLADEDRRCLLEAGHYDMTLQREDSGTTPAVDMARTDGDSGIGTLFPSPASSLDVPAAPSCPQHPSSQPYGQAVWESLPQTLHSLPALQGPSLRFVVTWPEGKPEFLQSRPPRSNVSAGVEGLRSGNAAHPPLSVTYNFIYRNGQRQQTETADKLTCPWCRVFCFHIYSLLKHMQLNHPRFTFSLTQRGQAYEIDVCLNSRYDVYYDSDLHPARRWDAVGQTCSRAPKKRTSFTKAFYGRRGRSFKFDLKEFQLLGGVGRVFFHCRTSLPVVPSEADEDSEDDSSPPEWISTKMADLLNEFTDVNNGEKAMMKLWNDYVLKERVSVDSEMPSACLSFTKLHASTIHRFDLQRNFLLHLSTLCDFGLISQECLHQCYAQVRLSGADSDGGGESVLT
eukprot:scpid39818/ scgid4987/ Polycomb protein Su(z)12; Suppressor 12 of zeste protein